MTGIACENIGVNGTTPVHIIQHDDGTFEARVGIAIMGSTNMDEQGFLKCGYNPFHEDFHDNYACGTGKTKEEAIEALKKDISDTTNSLWAF